MIQPVTRVGIAPAGATDLGATPPVPVARDVTGAAHGDVDFASLVGQAVADLAHKLRGAEVTSIAGVRGEASLQEVVETVMSAEQSLQSAIAVRDKIVSAYLEISRMAI